MCEWCRGARRVWPAFSLTCTPAIISVRLKYVCAESPPCWRLRALYTMNFVTSPSARPSLRK